MEQVNKYIHTLEQVKYLIFPYIYTSFRHLATLEVSRGSGNTARQVYCSWDILLVGYTARGQARFARSSTLLRMVWLLRNQTMLRRVLESHPTGPMLINNVLFSYFYISR